jgi:large subunit ribosomal protein L19
MKAIHSPVDIESRKKLDIRPGDTIRVSQRIVEGDKTRLQAFEGLVLSVKHGKEAGATFTVRKVASGVGVEKIFPLYSPMIEKIETIRSAKVRRAKLYYVREKANREIKRQMRNLRKISTEPETEAEASAEPEKAEATN